MSDSTREEIEAAAATVQEWRAYEDRLRLMPTTDWERRLAKAIKVLTEAALASRPALAEIPSEETIFVARPARLLCECTVCGEQVTVSNATEEWEKRHAHTVPAPVGEGEREELAATYEAAWSEFQSLRAANRDLRWRDFLLDRLHAAGYRKVVS